MAKKKKNVVVDYTARDFHSIRKRLMEHAKKYYPETFQDFSDLSFGSLLIDMVSYVGDQMSLYLDHSVNELFLPTASQYENVVKLGKQAGFKFDPIPAATGLVTLYLALPTDSTGQGPHFGYAPVLRAGTTFTSRNGANFTLTTPVDFGNVDTTTYLVIEEDGTSGAPTRFGAKAYGEVVSGRYVTEIHTISSHTPFLRVELDEENVSEILSVTDTEGHEYFEVEYLSQNLIYKAISNNNSNTKNTVPMVLKPYAAPRRFILERDGLTAQLRFGYGSETEEESLTILSPANMLLKRHGRDYISDFSFDPYRMLQSDKMGIAPQNTTLTISYRTNGVEVVNVPAATIGEVSNPRFQFERPDLLEQNRLTSVVSSLEVTNEEPFVGSSRLPSVGELRHRIMGLYAAQNRAVTLRDYKAIVYNLPKKFGSITKCRIERDADSFKNNINIYVLSEDAQGFLTLANSTTKSNLKVWMSRYKTVMDTIDILDARIVNLGIDFTVVGDRGAQSAIILSKCYRAILEELEDYTLDMGETFYISSIYRALARVTEVLKVSSVNIYQKTGNLYSDIFYDLNERKTPDGSSILAEKDVNFEIKYPEADIRGAVE